MFQRWIGLIVWLAPSVAFAAEPIADISYGWVLVKTIFVLVAVCALAYAGLKWGSKFVVNRTNQDRFKVLARLPVEPRRNIVVVQIADTYLVLGSSENGFSTLATLDKDQALSLVDVPTTAAKTFADVLEEST